MKNDIVEIEKKILENQSEHLKESIDMFFMGLINFDEICQLLLRS